LLGIVLGATSENARANEAQKLLNWGYTAFEAIKLFDADQAVVTPEVWKGTLKTAKLGRPQAVVVAVPAGTAGRLKTQVARPDPLIAPLTKGQLVGTLKVSSGDQALLDLPLMVLESVEQAGIASRAWDAVRLWIK
jgi:D-alanyl-D-alanine carboxypeptidase (penicillin-binding protein 5/6)